MSLGWYRQVDGLTHRLHVPAGWSDLYLTAGMTRTQPLLTVNAADLKRGVEYILGALDSTRKDDFAAIEVHIASSALHLVAGGEKHLRGVILPSAVNSPFEGTFLIDSTDFAPATLTGQVKVCLGAASDWAATVVFDGVEQDGIAVTRRSISSERWIWAAPKMPTIEVSWGELMVARHGLEAYETAVLAFAPDRLIVRSPEGVIATLLGTLEDEPVQSTVPRAALVAALDALPADVSRTRLATWGQTPAFHFSSTNTATYWLFTNTTSS